MYGLFCYGQDEQDTGSGAPISADGTCATCDDVTGETGGQMLTPPQPGVSQLPAGVPAEVPITPGTEGGEREAPEMGPCDLLAPWWAWLAGGLVLGFYAARRRA